MWKKKNTVYCENPAQKSTYFNMQLTMHKVNVIEKYIMRRGLHSNGARYWAIALLPFVLKFSFYFFTFPVWCNLENVRKEEISMVRPIDVPERKLPLGNQFGYWMHEIRLIL